MATVRLRNTNPMGDVYLDLIGRELTAGEEFEVDAELAGRPPFWRPVTDADRAELSLFRTRGEGDDLEVLDLGEGLLAQVGNYERVAKAAAKKGGEQA